MNRRVVLAVVAVAAVVIVFGTGLIPFGMPVPRNINVYGTVTVHSLYGGDDGGLGPALSSGDTIDAKDGLAVVWRPDPDYSGELTCQLFSAAGIWYEDGNWNLNTAVDPYFHLWGFTLDGVPKGTTEFYCAFGGKYTEDIDWTGSTIYFNIYSSTVPKDTVVVFTEEPDSEQSVEGGELLQLRWWFICEGSATATVYVDNVKVSSRNITPDSDPQVFTYPFQEYTEGDYTVELTITPKYGDEVSSSCEVTVTTTTTPTTTTDTDTTTTTTTDTGTTTTEPPPDEWEYLWIYALIVIVVIAVVIKVAK